MFWFAVGLFVGSFLCLFGGWGGVSSYWGRVGLLLLKRRFGVSDVESRFGLLLKRKFRVSDAVK